MYTKEEQIALANVLTTSIGEAWYSYNLVDFTKEDQVMQQFLVANKVIDNAIAEGYIDEPTGIRAKNAREFYKHM